VTDLYVDVDALNELSRQLNQIKSSLEQAPDAPHAHGGRLGSQKMEGALGDFISGWKDGRKKIIDAIGGLLGQIQAAIDTYEQQEKALSAAGKKS
jgi:rubrerythrin